MDEWSKAGIALCVLLVGFIGGFMLSEKQIDWLLVDAVKSAKNLGVQVGKAEEKIAGFKTDSEKMLSEVTEISTEQQNLQAELSKEIASQTNIVKERAKELDLLEEEISTLQERVTGREGDLAVDRIRALNTLLSDNKDAEILTQLSASVKNLESRLESNLVKKRKPGPAIELPHGTPWGNWKGVKHCPVNQYVCGIEQRVESRKSDQDDTGVNSIRFYCCPL